MCGINENSYCREMVVGKVVNLFWGCIEELRNFG